MSIKQGVALRDGVEMDSPGTRLRRDALMLLVAQHLGERLNVDEAARLIAEHGRVDDAFRMVAVNLEQRREQSKKTRRTPGSGPTREESDGATLLPSRRSGTPDLRTSDRDAFSSAMRQPPPSRAMRFAALVLMIAGLAEIVTVAWARVAIGTNGLGIRGQSIDLGSSLAAVAAIAGGIRLSSRDTLALVDQRATRLLDLLLIMAIETSYALPLILANIVNGGTQSDNLDVGATHLALSLALLMALLWKRRTEMRSFR